MAKKTAEEILKELQEQERKEQEDFQRKQVEKREKALAAILEPLRAEKAKLDEQWKAAIKRIDEIDKEIAKLTGKPLASKGAKEKGKRAPRKSKGEKLMIAEQVINGMEKGKKYASSDLQDKCEGVPFRQLFDLWKESKKTPSVKREGTKATATYSLA